MDIKRWTRVSLLASAGALCIMAGATVRGRAEIHNGGVDCTDWNGTYELVGASADERRLLPPDKDSIVIKQNSCSGCDMEVTIGGERCLIEARTNDSLNRHPMTIRGRTYRVYATWVDGYGKNWTVTLTPDPLRPDVPYSLREWLLTSFHTVTVQDTIRDPRNMIPLATFPQPTGRGARGGSKIRDVVNSRAVYLMSVPERTASR